MLKYWLIFKISTLDQFEYRFDFILQAIKYAAAILMMAILWSAVSRENPNLPLNQAEIVTYYFIASIIYSLTNFHTFYVEEDIRLGYLSKYLLKPVSSFGHYLAYETSQLILDLAVKIILIVPLMIYLGYLITPSFFNLFLFLTFVTISFFCAFCLFVLISSFTFWLTETWALRWALTIIFRFLSGMLVPIIFFPQSVQSVLYYLPFQHFVYTPIMILENKMSLEQIGASLSILLIWTVLIFGLNRFVWHQGEKIYENTGV